MSLWGCINSMSYHHRSYFKYPRFSKARKIRSGLSVKGNKSYYNGKKISTKQYNNIFSSMEDEHFTKDRRGY